MSVINEQQLVVQLKELTQTFAVETLKRPVGKTEFDYGVAAGTIQGIAKAEELILKLLRGDEPKDGKQRTKTPNPY